jgi:hypothetical protein
MTKAQALEIAKNEISKLKEDTEFIIFDDRILEKKDGWVFFYNTKKFIDTGDPTNLIPGIVPIFINKSDGSVRYITVFDNLNE